jgi:DNA-nicking Smr family endonuclease
MVVNNFYDEFPPEIDNLRDRAQELAKKRGDCFERSQQVFKNGDKAKAKELSDEGKKYDQEMDECNRKAANLIFKLNNTDKKLPIHEIDLHGLFVEESKTFVEERIKLCKSKNVDALIIIVGRGNHSADKIPKIKPAIEELVRIHGIESRINEPNQGCITLLFKKGAKVPEYGNKPAAASSAPQKSTPQKSGPQKNSNSRINSPKAQNTEKVTRVANRDAAASDNNASGGCIIC